MFANDLKKIACFWPKNKNSVLRGQSPTSTRGSFKAHLDEFSGPGGIFQWSSRTRLPQTFRWPECRRGASWSTDQSSPWGNDGGELVLELAELVPKPRFLSLGVADGQHLRDGLDHVVLVALDAASLEDLLHLFQGADQNADVLFGLDIQILQFLKTFNELVLVFHKNINCDNNNQILTLILITIRGRNILLLFDSPEVQLVFEGSVSVWYKQDSYCLL